MMILFILLNASREKFLVYDVYFFYKNFYIIGYIFCSVRFYGFELRVTW